VTPATALAAGLAATAGWVLAGRRRAAVRRLGAELAVEANSRLHRPTEWLASARRPWVAGLLGCGLLVATGAGIAAIAVVGVVGAVAVRQRTAARRRTASRREEERGVAAMVALATELRSGRPPADALVAAATEAGPQTARALRRAAATARLGGDVAAALRAAAEPLSAAQAARGRAAADVEPTAVRWALAAAWAVGTRSGAGLAAPVERIADGLTATVALRAELAAQLAGPRATAGLLAGLPVLGAGLATVGGATPLHFLLHTPLGAGCLLGGVLLDVAGLLWTQAIVHRALRGAA
jgi:tight adherence protein B